MVGNAGRDRLRIGELMGNVFSRISIILIRTSWNVGIFRNMVSYELQKDEKDQREAPPQITSC